MSGLSTRSAAGPWRPAARDHGLAGLCASAGPQLGEEAVAGAGRHQVEVLVAADHHAHEGGSRRRRDVARQRLALAARRGQAVGRQRVGAARRVEEDGALVAAPLRRP